MKNRSRKGDALTEQLERQAKNKKVVYAKLYRLKVPLKKTKTRENLEFSTIGQDTGPSTSGQDLVISTSGQNPVPLSSQTQSVPSIKQADPLPDPLASSGALSSRWSKYRHTKKITEAMPGTPAKKAELILNIDESPSIKEILKKRACLTPIVDKNSK